MKYLFFIFTIVASSSSFAIHHDSINFTAKRYTAVDPSNPCPSPQLGGNDCVVISIVSPPKARPDVESSTTFKGNTCLITVGFISRSASPQNVIADSEMFPLRNAGVATGFSVVSNALYRKTATSNCYNLLQVTGTSDVIMTGDYYKKVHPTTTSVYAQIGISYQGNTANNSIGIAWTSPDAPNNEIPIPPVSTTCTLVDTNINYSFSGTENATVNETMTKPMTINCSSTGTVPSYDLELRAGAGTQTNTAGELKLGNTNIYAKVTVNGTSLPVNNSINLNNLINNNNSLNVGVSLSGSTNITGSSKATGVLVLKAH